TPDVDEFLADVFSAEDEQGGIRYVYENLCEGDYIVQTAPENFNEGGILNGYSGSTGHAVPGHGVVSSVITLTAGDTSEFDFGFYKPDEPEPEPENTEYQPMKPF
ncbi:MAG: hypothetical protein DRI57_19655, partial [Deltaproteobacteria bacterium]